MKLTVKNLRKSFGNFLAVFDLSFELETGEITAFVGPNGAGKTTTMRILSTIELPTYGQIELDGVSLIEYPEVARKHVGYVPDSLPLNPDMSVHEYLDFFARAYGLKNPERKERVMELEEFTNLTGIKDKMVDSLSKGMKQRVSIARALISDPDYLLMDEPAAGLDPRARIELRELLKVLRDQGKGILISSHILSELSEICTSTVIIERGRLLKSGKLDKVLDDIEKASGDQKKRLHIKVLERTEDLAKLLLVEPLVSDVNIVNSTIEFAFEGNDEQMAALLPKLMTQGYKIVNFGVKQQNLETAFMSITKGSVQ